ncbi:MAG: surface glycoprotein, partial [Halobacteriaceae archaeon]
MTDTTQRLRAVFLAALMLVSVFAGTIAFAGSAAASVSGSSASNVAGGFADVQQTVQVQGTAVGGEGGNDTYVLDFEGASTSIVSAGGSVTDAEVTSTGSDDSVTRAAMVDGNNVKVSVADGGTGDSGAVSFTVTVTWDLTDVAADGTSYGVNIDQYDSATSTSTSGTETVNFGAIERVTNGGTSTDNIVVGDTAQSINGTAVTLADANGSTVKVYYNLTTLANHGVDLDSLNIDNVQVTGATFDSSSVSSNSGVTVAELTFTGASSSFTVNGLDLTGLDTSNAVSASGLAYEVNASVGTSSDSRFDSSNGNAPGAESPATATFKITSDVTKSSSYKVLSKDHNSPAVVFQGQTAFTNGFKADTTVTLRRNTSSGSTYVDEYTADTDGQLVFDTDDLQDGENYFVRGTGSNTNTTTAYFEVIKQSLTLSTSDTSV